MKHAAHLGATRKPVRDRKAALAMTPDPHIGWPRVPRETLTWPEQPAEAMGLVPLGPTDEAPAAAADEALTALSAAIRIGDSAALQPLVSHRVTGAGTEEVAA